jgi:hypothetical protein
VFLLYFWFRNWFDSRPARVKARNRAWESQNQKREAGRLALIAQRKARDEAIAKRLVELKEETHEELTKRPEMAPRTTWEGYSRRRAEARFAAEEKNLTPRSARRHRNLGAGGSRPRPGGRGVRSRTRAEARAPSRTSRRGGAAGG